MYIKTEFFLFSSKTQHTLYIYLVLFPCSPTDHLDGTISISCIASTSRSRSPDTHIRENCNKREMGKGKKAKRKIELMSAQPRSSCLSSCRSGPAPCSDLTAIVPCAIRRKRKGENLTLTGSMFITFALDTWTRTQLMPNFFHPSLRWLR